MEEGKKRIVVKVGSNVLTRPDGKPNVTNMSALVDQIARLHADGHEIVLVSSGAVACGRGAVSRPLSLDSVASRQLYSSIGQIRLINLYNQLFGEYGILVGQVLTQKENFSSRDLYLNQRGCMLTMIDNGVIPIVNENDTASLTELMFTDNDELSGLIATMLDADMLVILSNIDGIYTGSPDDPASVLIPRVAPGEDPSAYVVAAKSGFGRGGMGTKCGIARKVSAEGVAVVIARGDRPGVLVDIVGNPASVPHTIFEPSLAPLSTIKRWIAHSSSFAKGEIHINANAAGILRSDKAVSLLPVGVTAVSGEWEEGDIVSVLSPQGERIAVGRAAMDSRSAAESIGRHGQRPLIHYDYLYLEEN
ncbi:MAG: glutamate 5-kinase [Muribaculaceae bacterium]|nr:glutamate 5-kinase [Muribaculaceae bacterium]MDE6361146.1 glutamate 5-kinase [Muribaculaceae bacterium]